MSELREAFVETVRGIPTFWEAGATPTGAAWGKAKIDGKKVQVWRFKFGTTEANTDFDTLKQACADGALVMAEVYCKDRTYTYQGNSGVTTDRTINVISILDSSGSEGGESQSGPSSPTSSDSTSLPTAEPRADAALSDELGELFTIVLEMNKKLDRLLTPGNGAQRESATAIPTAATNTPVSATSSWADDATENLVNGLGAVEEVA